MPTPNPLYNPDWEALYDHHAARRDELQEQISAGYTNGLPGDQMKPLQQEWDEHHQACLDSFRIRFPTVQEYAHWVFKNFDTAMSAGTAVPTFSPDFEAFTTLEDVDQTWKEYHAAATEAGRIERLSLPTGRPDGRDIFEDGPGRQLYTRERFFSAQDLFGNPSGMWGDRGITALISADVRPHEIHICLMETFHRQPGPSVTNFIENVATRLLEDVNESMKQKHLQLEHKPSGERKPGLLSTLMKLAVRTPAPAAGQTSGYRPDQLHFYIHIPPETGLEEGFSEVTFKSFKNGKYQGPEWNQFDVIPERIQKARFSNSRSIETALARAPGAPTNS